MEGPGGPLWFPRLFQGDGRHDNRDAYGCLYVAEQAVSSVIEQFARFRGRRLTPARLRRRGLPLALAGIELDQGAALIDLDDARVLSREGLRPSEVATRHREVTQPRALGLYHRHPDAAGLRWWSTWEALWTNVTLFDRAGPRLRVAAIREVTLETPTVLEAADLLGLRI